MKYKRFLFFSLFGILLGNINPVVYAQETGTVNMASQAVPEEVRAYARYAMDSAVYLYYRSDDPQDLADAAKNVSLGEGFSLYRIEADGSYSPADSFYFPIYHQGDILFVMTVFKTPEGWKNVVTNNALDMKNLEDKPGTYIYCCRENGPMEMHEVRPEDAGSYETIVPLYPGTTERNASLFRLYNSNNGEHFYTENTKEAENLKNLGWNLEGSGWVAPLDGEAVYRLYNPNSGEHHYTTDNNERNGLANLGWNDEGFAFYSDLEKSVPVYRLFNPNARDAGSHMYTTSRQEADQLTSIGWRDEGIGWYADLEGWSVNQ